MARSVVMLLLAFVGCASPHRDFAIAYDPATKIITGTLDSGWMGGPVTVYGEYRTPDGTELVLFWSSDADLAAAVSDNAATREALKETVIAAIDKAP